MKYAKDYEILDFPENFKFGVEIEADNVKTKGKNGLYTGKSAQYIKDKNWHMATSSEEMLVAEGRCRTCVSYIKRYRTRLAICI